MGERAGSDVVVCLGPNWGGFWSFHACWLREGVDSLKKKRRKLGVQDVKHADEMEEMDHFRSSKPVGLTSIHSETH